MMAGDHAHQKPRAGAGIAEIERRLGLCSPPMPTPPTVQAPSGWRVDGGAEPTHRRGRAQHVLAFEKTLDARVPDGERRPG